MTFRYIGYIDFHLPKLIMNSHDQLQFGLIAQMVENCTGIAEIRVQIPFMPEILTFFFANPYVVCI